MLGLAAMYVGVPYSPATGLPIESQTVSQMADRILALPSGTRLFLNALPSDLARQIASENAIALYKLKN